MIGYDWLCCCAVLCCIVLCCTVSFPRIVLHCFVLCCPALCCSVPIVLFIIIIIIIIIICFFLAPRLHSVVSDNIFFAVYDRRQGCVMRAISGRWLGTT